MNLEDYFNLDFYNIDKANLISGLLATKLDKNYLSKKRKCKINKLDIAKQANFSGEIFEYIYVTKYEKLYAIA